MNLKTFKPLTKTKYIDNVVFIFIGRLLVDKGIIEFVQAAKIIKQKYPNAIFHVLGDLDEQNPSCIPKKLLLNWIDDKIIRYFGVTNDIRNLSLIHI